jgi:hypothetical protein
MTNGIIMWGKTTTSAQRHHGQRLDHVDLFLVTPEHVRSASEAPVALRGALDIAIFAGATARSQRRIKREASER